jgi:hypothetical protein
MYFSNYGIIFIMIKLLHLFIIISITYSCASTNEKEILQLKKEILELQAKIQNKEPKKINEKKEEELFSHNIKSVTLPQMNNGTQERSYKQIELDSNLFFLFNSNGDYLLKVDASVKEASLSIESKNEKNTLPEDLFFIKKENSFISKGYSRVGNTSFKLILKTTDDKKLLYNFEINL